MSESVVAKTAREGNNVEGYYIAMAAQGDAYAVRALMVVRNECVSWETCSMASANFSLKATAAINFVDVDMQDIRVRLMNAHAAAVMRDTLGVPGLLNPRQIADYHFDVFNAVGLPNATFGGTPLTGFRWEASFWREIPGLDWCVGCDTQ